MTQYNNLNVKLCNWQLNKLKSVIKNETESNITKVVKSFENRGILLKQTTRKITRQDGGSPNFLRPLMIVGLSLMKSVLTALAKNILWPFGLLVAMSEPDAAVKKRFMDQELQH